MNLLLGVGFVLSLCYAAIQYFVSFRHSPLGTDPYAFGGLLGSAMLACATAVAVASCVLAPSLLAWLRASKRLFWITCLNLLIGASLWFWPLALLWAVLSSTHAEEHIATQRRPNMRTLGKIASYLLVAFGSSLLDSTKARIFFLDLYYQNELFAFLVPYWPAAAAVLAGIFVFGLSARVRSVRLQNGT